MNYYSECNSNSVPTNSGLCLLYAHTFMVSFPIVFPRECSAISSYGKCFTLVFNSTPRTWNESKFDCSEQDQSLGSVLSQNEEGIMTAVGANNTFWVGLNDMENEGQYEWVDGSTYTSVNWYPGFPQNSPTSNCVVVYSVGYADLSCGIEYSWHLCTSTGE